ncbi:MAG: hypothetical protein KatS3mg115_0711 [Candidatus Poribacteria bacterium]|nr:MAG: hypothetical protein KatS3mg115_0711 [Candidatus Poribacteria bacterium]
MSQARERYSQDGYWIHPDPIFPEELIRRAVAGMDALRRGEYETGVPPEPSPWNPGDDPGRLCKIEQPQKANRAIRELIAYPELGRLAAEVTGARWVQVWWVQLLLKPPTDDPSAKTKVGWHQDRQYWGIWEEGSELFTAWVALSDVGPESGPMRFVRGSHRWGLLGMGDFFGQDLDAQKRALLERGLPWEEVVALLPPGGVSFHHCLTYHASTPNLSTAPRRSFAIHMRTERSRPVGDRREGLARFIDDEWVCPVVYTS